jgi:hypothetical protein
MSYATLAIILQVDDDSSESLHLSSEESNNGHLNDNPPYSHLNSWMKPDFFCCKR